MENLEKYLKDNEESVKSTFGGYFVDEDVKRKKSDWFLPTRKSNTLINL
jgi:hypothetical protein